MSALLDRLSALVYWRISLLVLISCEQFVVQENLLSCLLFEFVVFSSTMSAGLNTVSGTIYEDFVQMFLKGKKLSETKQNVIIKLTTLVLGIFCIIMVFVVEKMGAIFQVSFLKLCISSRCFYNVFFSFLFLLILNNIYSSSTKELQLTLNVFK